MIRRPPRSTQSRSSAASDVYKRQAPGGGLMIDRNDAVRLAEQATLGSLLYLPQAVDDVGRWLRSGDFADPWHAQVYRLIREHHAAGHHLDATALGSEMLSELGPRRSNPVSYT